MSFYGTVFHELPQELEPGYGIPVAVNLKMYGIFTRKQAQRRIRHINGQIKLRKRKRIELAMGTGGGRGVLQSMTQFRQSRQHFMGKINFQTQQIGVLTRMRKTIAKRWNLTEKGRRKKGGGRFLLWRKRR